MAKESKVVEVKKGFWKAIEGKKESLTDTVDIEFAGETAEMTVQFVDIDKEQEVRAEYEEMLPPKPTIKENISGKERLIEVPNDDPKFKVFNTSPEAKEKIKEWERECKPIERKMMFRLAYEFLAPEDRPMDNPDEAVEFMDKHLNYMSAVKIVNKGHELNDIGGLIKKQEVDS